MKTRALLISLCLCAALSCGVDIIHQPEQPGDVPITYANIEKAQRLLGYHPKTKIEDGIPKFVEWFLQQQ